MGCWIFLAGPFVGQNQNFFLTINHRPESCVSVFSTLIAYLAHVFAMTQPRWSSSFLLVMTPTKTRLGRVASTSVFLLMRFWLSIHSSSSWRSGGSPDKSLSTATRSESILEPKSKHYIFINRVWPKHLEGKIRFKFGSDLSKCNDLSDFGFMLSNRSSKLYSPPHFLSHILYGIFEGC